MSDQSDDQKRPLSGPKEGDVLPADNNLRDVQAISELLRGVTEPLARSQDVAQQEGTKRAQIFADVTLRFHQYSFVIGAGVLLIAGVAMFLGQTQLTEKIVFALLGFLGGFGLARGLPRA